MTDSFRRNAARSWLLRALLLYFFIAVAAGGLLFAAPLLIRVLLAAPSLNQILNLVIVVASGSALTLLLAWLRRASREEANINRFAAANLSGAKAPAATAGRSWDLARIGHSAIRDRVQFVQELAHTGAAYDGSALAGALADREESRVAIARYSASTLVLLGLLGTFVGLLVTIAGVADVVEGLSVSSAEDIEAFLIPLKSGLRSSLEGMALAFSTSLLGLTGSLVVGAGALMLGAAQASWMGKLEQLSSLYLGAPAAPTLAAAEVAPRAVAPATGLAGLEASTRFLRDAQGTVGEQLGRLDHVSERMAGTLGDFRDRAADLATRIEALQSELARIADGQTAGGEALHDLGRKLADLVGTAAAVKADVRDGRGELGAELNLAARGLREGLISGLEAIASTLSHAPQGGHSQEMATLRAELSRASADRREEARAIVEELRRLRTGLAGRPPSGKTAVPEARGRG